VRRITRQPLNQDVQADLIVRQTSVDQKRNTVGFSATDEWKTARQSYTLSTVLTTLRHMTGERQRCVYCLDSHGTDIEHFWPKTPYPERMFDWLNLLLCCAECGRFKGDRFPVVDQMPLLVDPTAEDPWQYLDFDPTTGNIVPRFDVDLNDYAIKGVETVKLLQLDQREAIASGYKKTLRRLSQIVEDAIRHLTPSAEALIAQLIDADDHGLLTWCFLYSGRNEVPFCTLRDRYPAVWAACVAAFS